MPDDKGDPIRAPKELIAEQAALKGPFVEDFL
jgi:hypothetical protein